MTSFFWPKNEVCVNGHLARRGLIQRDLRETAVYAMPATDEVLARLIALPCALAVLGLAAGLVMVGGVR